ncbi:C4-dicarboxylate TRAP transporter substrate-binding protein [Thalassospira alkalitolerans]|uniref:C4-dicarboxylate ABC transporter substrate-binding protein n=2 Tax=Thalassospira alkalitolerans TaxID=1293890 RepID=A0A1Y2LE71_9PROT|nr:C4-dicarboxylate TRAP transporter substrate-binding protein [Thalassospira alkalitolerans]OSQ49379.1 C4-dicarboxylate ABC transporter substrate-binding protein [Thalassospira alkalitolerans]|tara:strand:- start:346002 stop:347138 length:1137 start_codon:yes stop_codon:yes gene_type:complete
MLNKKTITPFIAALMAAGSALPLHAETNFIANSFYDAEHPLSKFGYVEWADTVREISGGDLNPEVYTGTVLLAPRASLQGARDNIANVANIAAVYTPSELPVANAVQELGFNYSDPLTAIFAVADFSIHNEVQQKEWADNGIVYLGAYATPPYILFCSKPVRTLEEIKGKRIRTAGSSVSKWVEEVGGIPVNVPSSEMYTGLERGTLDCATNAANDLIDRSLWEVAPYTTELSTGMYWSGPEWGFNAGFWSGLTTTQRKQLMDATAHAMSSMVVNYLARSNAALDEAKAKGNEIYQPSAELMASVEAFREKVLGDIYTVAEDKYGVADGMSLIDDFRFTYAKWEGLLENVDRTDIDALDAIARKEIYGTLDPATYGVN